METNKTNPESASEDNLVSELVSLKPDVKMEDKNRASTKYCVTVRTIEKYLEGNIGNRYIAKNLLSDLTAWVNKRKQVA